MALALSSVVIVQNVLNFVKTLRRQTLRKQHQHASNGIALARFGSADAAALIATPAAASTFSQHIQQATTALAARTLGRHSRMMPEPYSDDASRSQKHNPPSLAVAASQGIFAARAFLPLFSIILGKPLATSLSPKGPAARTERASHMPQILV